MTTSAPSPDAAAQRAAGVRLMGFDVDGVLTDGRLWVGPDGEMLKVFHSFDGHGVKMLRDAGVVLAIISGRSGEPVRRRAAELGFDHVMLGIHDKRQALEQLLAQTGIEPSAMGFIGDDVVDLPVLTRVGFAATVSEAPIEVRSRVHWIASQPAGGGAVRELCEFVLKAQGRWDAALAPYLA